MSQSAIAIAPAWSPLQEAIFAEVASGAGHLIVEACPGSGKSTTLVESFSCHATANRILCAAFGRETKATLEARLPGDIDVLTWHGYGMRACMRAWGSLNLKPYEINNRAGKLVGRGKFDKPKRDFVVAVISAAKATLTDISEDSLDELADEWGIDCPPKAGRSALIQAAVQLLDEDSTDGPRDGVIHYDDMCWMPIVHDLVTPAYDLVGVDETQDLNAAQLELAVKAAGTGRIVAIGDRRQSIFGFRGADRHAIPRMIDRLSAATLPLNVCYRCGSSIVAEAAKIWPEIVPMPGAHEGVVRQAQLDECRSKAVPGDFVVSRLNAPLISLCLGWLAAGKRARILGRDIGKGLLAQIQKIGASDVDQILRAIDAWEEREIARLTERDRPTDQVTEKADCIRMLCEGLETIQQVEARVEALFTDVTADSCITLASTHKAKGLEASRVWLLKDTYCRKFIKSGGLIRVIHDPSSADDEERNLFYVGITRAQHELIYVRGC